MKYTKIICTLAITFLLLIISGCVQSEDTIASNMEDQSITESIVTEDNAELLSQKEITVSRVNAAIELMDEKGELAFDEFREVDSQWAHGDIYITVWEIEGTRIVFPPDASGEGVDVNGLEDANGKPIGKLFIETVLSEEGEGWVNYHWPKPGETEASAKSTFIKRAAIGNQTYLVNSGFYVNDYVYTKDLATLEYIIRPGIEPLGETTLGILVNSEQTGSDPSIDFSIAHFVVEPEHFVELRMMKNPETFYILHGECTLYIEEIPFELKKDDLILVPPNSKQYMENTGSTDLKFFVVNQPAWTAENEIIF